MCCYCGDDECAGCHSMGPRKSDREETQARLVLALMALVKDGIAPDVQELLMYGNPDLGVKPNALEHAIAAALAYK